MRHHMDDSLPHQSGKPDGAAAVVGEHQERAGIGNEPPCSAMPFIIAPCRAHGYHSGEASRVIPRRDDGLVFRLGKVRAGEIGRAAECRWDNGVDGFERNLRGFAGGDCGLLGDKLRLQLLNCRTSVGTSSDNAAVKLSRNGGVAVDKRFPTPCGRQCCARRRSATR